MHSLHSVCNFITGLLCDLSVAAFRPLSPPWCCFFVTQRAKDSHGYYIYTVATLFCTGATSCGTVTLLYLRGADKITTTIAESGMLGKLLFDTAFNSRLRTIESGQRPGGVIGK